MTNLSIIMFLYNINFRNLQKFILIIKTIEKYYIECCYASKFEVRGNKKSQIYIYHITKV